MDDLFTCGGPLRSGVGGLCWGHVRMQEEGRGITLQKDIANLCSQMNGRQHNSSMSVKLLHRLVERICEFLNPSN